VAVAGVILTVALVGLTAALLSVLVKEAAALILWLGFVLLAGRGGLGVPLGGGGGLASLAILGQVGLAVALTLTSLNWIGLALTSLAGGRLAFRGIAATLPPTAAATMTL
jgi:hypothetical protein